MSKQDAIDHAVRAARDSKETQCVFMKASRNSFADYAWGSAYSEAPKGFKPESFVSVTGLVRVIG